MFPTVKVTLEQLRHRLAMANERRRHFERKSEQPRMLVRHELWRHAYLAKPYLIGAPDERVAERMCAVFMNLMELGANGKLQPEPVHDTYTQVFTHLLEEYAPRGGLPPEVIGRARAPLRRYFEHGTPVGVTMFERYKRPTTPILVKYGNREFLEPMMQSGTLRLANAALYNRACHNAAIRDDETSRTFFIPTYQERLAGQSHLDFQGCRIEFSDDDIVLPLVMDDYYLFSLCEHIHYRMPSDFGADAAIVIRDPNLFIKRLAESFSAVRPDWLWVSGKVTYYDPYRDYSKFNVPEMAKHFAYAYQKEFRIAFRPRRPITSTLEPLFLSIGPMTDYADLICA